MILGLATIAASLSMTLSVLLYAAGVPLWICLVAYAAVGAALTIGLALGLYKMRENAPSTSKGPRSGSWQSEIDARNASDKDVTKAARPKAA